ncbi:hypothetical protein M758_UG188700 [Ceratodon purpureus]|nr:hypothetical protein M758_UG187300 [Ceratodon purpureus]KAG0595689.1 hypothetical protein M758_UG188700 [Ceratodon purpureus]
MRRAEQEEKSERGGDRSNETKLPLNAKFRDKVPDRIGFNAEHPPVPHPARWENGCGGSG